MIQKLRKKLVLTIMTVLFLLVFLVSLTMYLCMMRVCGQMSSHILQNLAENAGTLRQAEQLELVEDVGIGTLIIRREALFQALDMPLYMAELDQEGAVCSLEDLRSRTPLDPAPLQSALSAAARQAPGPGKDGAYRFYKLDRPEGSLVVLMDRTQSFEQDILLRFAHTAAAISAPVLLALLLVSLVLSRFALSPAVRAFQRQKDFISDAGHELKTPLSAIAVNAAVLEAEQGPSKYMDCIQAETRRMDTLVRRLLEIAYVEDGGPARRRERFSLSQVVYQSTLPFESIAFEQGIQYHVDLQEDCHFTGDPELVRHILSVLLDNAFKYAAPQGEVSVRLRREGRRFAIEVFNTGRGISREDLPHIFERFYRCDKARPGNGSYGLGLAIAQAAAEACGGSIRAESEYGCWARFRVTL